MSGEVAFENWKAGSHFLKRRVLLLGMTSCAAWFLRGQLGNLERSYFDRFQYLLQIDKEIMPQFVTILKSVILNLSVRFFCIGFSLNNKTIRSFLNYENMTIDPIAPLENSSRCGLSPLLEVFNLRRRMSQPICH